jgi:hypothetical protein
MVQTGDVVGQSVSCRWTVASWLLAREGRDVDAVVRALTTVEADAVAVQSVRAREATAIATHLDLHHVWAKSHHPRSPLIPRSALGLAIMSPHRITGALQSVVGEHTSIWSTKRRIVQIATVQRTSDHTAYSFGHSLAPVDVFDGAGSAAPGSAPLVVIRPARIGVDDARAIEVPDTAAVSSVEVRRPIPTAEPLLVTAFEMPWVEGGFASA